MSKTTDHRIDGTLIRQALDGRKLPWLADRTGIGYLTIYRIATNKSTPNAHQMLAICRVLNQPITAFAAATPSPQARKANAPLPD